MNFEVSTLTGRSLTIKTYPDAMVSDLQNEIAKEEGLPVSCQQLMVKERMLLSGEKLENIAINHGHTLYLLSNVKAGMEVRITCITGEYIYILIDNTTTVYQLKMEIEEKRDIAVNTQRLVITIGDKETEMTDKEKVMGCLPDKQVEYTIYLLMKGLIGTRQLEGSTLERMEVEPELESSSYNSFFWRLCSCNIL